MNTTVEHTPNAVLHGGHHTTCGPYERYIYVDDVAGMVKISTGNGYDHFVPTNETTSHQGQDVRVFVWSHRTYVAE